MNDHDHTVNCVKSGRRPWLCYQFLTSLLNLGSNQDLVPTFKLQNYWASWSFKHRWTLNIEPWSVIRKKVMKKSYLDRNDLIINLQAWYWTWSSYLVTKTRKLFTSPIYTRTRSFIDLNVRDRDFKFQTRHGVDFYRLNADPYYFVQNFT